LITLASIALPGMNGFVGEFLILLGSFSGRFDPDRARIYTAVAASGVILSAVYMLWMFQRVNYGPLTNDKNRGLRDLSLREWFVITPICAMAIVMGVVPNVFLRPMEPAVRKTIEQVRPLSVPRRPVNTELLVPVDQAQGLRPKAQEGSGSQGPASREIEPENQLGPSAYGLRPAGEARR
jgi:NADH-quinone oxidoreductase subunit M